ncbi:2805_t:CDS:2 [Diversispora eburnea]|uniref:2805_t:CDS:1 n=1 Tax=Diversispora eburnea TaxID=1213867 RepID=A0A9N9CRT9_9GLOM|nr:2805_t:CDS:2 [Diversispora eburnea]
MDNKTLLNNHEYLHSSKTNSYRRRFNKLNDKSENGKNSQRKYRSPPPRHAHHQPVMKFNSDMWMQDYRQTLIEKLFKEERFKAFQKRRGLENFMDVSDDEDWPEQQNLIQSIVQNSTEDQQLQTQQQILINNLTTETKLKWFQYRERPEL